MRESLLSRCGSLQSVKPAALLGIRPARAVNPPGRPCHERALPCCWFIALLSLARSVSLHTACPCIAGAVLSAWPRVSASPCCLCSLLIAPVWSGGGTQAAREECRRLQAAMREIRALQDGKGEPPLRTHPRTYPPNKQTNKQTNKSLTLSLLYRVLRYDRQAGSRRNPIRRSAGPVRLSTAACSAAHAPPPTNPLTPSRNLTPNGPHALVAATPRRVPVSIGGAQ
jgi:hypothetical protein